ncbi:TspO/MBR related protein [Roseibium hamelinense]|uniref:TspO/MBR related protein n=1 Tax=Roseibium hamelinense TaxID=150831 RepID=A0A562SXV8_9HYPH|nr:TspO/MBR family protein [Roseibium hamelinense]MTI44872.1 tryptophan-rich sensory protein [Roseibium hamelinense]TWI85933.1 TspO/MBR related protein [Roseibium hamelinense]
MAAGFVFGILVFLTAMSGAVFKPGDWYLSLKKPSWTPPGWAFPLVWTVLYVMIGYSGWLIWSEQGFGLALVFWVLQLALNGAWSWLFFGMKRMDYALIDVCAMWLSIVAYIGAAWPVSTTAALLFLPYLAWVSVAAALNLSVWRLNPDEVPA